VPTVPPAVGAAVYRIVQQSLTNAVQHAGPEVRIRVAVQSAGQGLRVTVTDDGPATPRPPLPPDRSEGYGIAGMRERARSVGGTLKAAPREDAPGYEVVAHLPLAETGSAPVNTTHGRNPHA
jgi:signal transduction histidine kinase